MNPSTLSVYPQAPDCPTIGRVVEVYLGHLALRVETESYSRDNFLNRRRELSRFCQAWSVAFADGRHVLVPLAEPELVTAPNGKRYRKRRAPLIYGAGNATDALVKARELIRQLKAGIALAEAAAGEPTIRANGARRLAECTNDDLVAWVLANPQWKSGHTKTNAMAAIVDCFIWYEDEFKVPSPFKRRRLPAFVKLPRREAQTGEYIALMRHRSSRALRRALWALWNVQGLRTCEMREMIWADFNWDGAFVLTFKHKTARLTGKPRLVVLTPRQLRFFRNLHRQRPPWPDNVFLNTDGQAWTRRSLALHVRRAARRIGLDDDVVQKVSAYCFRHSFATQADEAGADMSDTGMVMGHAPGSKITRAVYSKKSSKVQQNLQAAQRIEKLRRQARHAEGRKRRPPEATDQPELF